jgi:mRNA interferase MazF
MTSSMNCSRNDVVLLPIPFTDLTSRKVRPAIVLGRNGVDIFLVPISSVISNTDFLLTDWRSAGLNVPCGVKGQIATVDER